MQRPWILFQFDWGLWGVVSPHLFQGSALVGILGAKPVDALKSHDLNQQKGSEFLLFQWIFSLKSL